MSAKPLPNRMTYEEYLAFSAAAEVKHEYINGEAYAMAGGTLEHSAIAARLIGIVIRGLRGRPCQVFTSDLRIRVATTRANFYPDVSVVCGKAETEPTDPLSVLNPTVLVEVLSPTTGESDRGAKAAHYRRIPSLKEYLLVSPTDRTIEIQRRSERGVWEIHLFEAGQVARVESLGVDVPVDEVFADPLAQAT